MMDEMPDECCAKCRFLHSATNRGKCHRFPPVFDHTTNPSVPHDVRWTFPIVMLDDWCGEFQPQKAPTT